MNPYAPGQEQLANSRAGSNATLEWVGPTRLELSPGVPFPDPFPTQGPGQGAQIIVETDLAIALRSEPEKMADAGSWVVTLDHFAEFEDVLPGDTLICPTHARVSLGTGGSHQEFETDTKNQVFSLSGSKVTIVVEWDRTVPANNSDFWFWKVPRRVRIVAQLQRAFTTARATRSLWVTIPGVNGVQSTIGDVPNFARCVRLWGRRDLDTFAAPPSGARLSFGPELVPSAALMVYLGENLRNPAGVPVPVLAQRWGLTWPLTVIDPHGPLEFELAI